MQYDTINGTKIISTATDYHDDGKLIGLLLVSAVDAEGSYDDIYLFISVEEEDSGDGQDTDVGLSLPLMNLVIIIVTIIILISVVLGLVYIFRKEPRVPERERFPEEISGLEAGEYEGVNREMRTYPDTIERDHPLNEQVPELKSTVINPRNTIDSLIKMGDRLKEAGMLKQAKEKFKAALKVAKNLEDPMEKERLVMELKEFIDDVKRKMD